MLQSSVQLPPLSLSSSPKIPPLVGKDTDDYVRSHESTSASLLPNSLNNKCIQKEGFATRPAFAGLPPPSIVPFSISTNLSPSTSSSPSTASSKLPRSPYTSSGRTSSPVSFPGLHSWASKPTTYSRPSSTVSSTIEDVLVPGDVVGQGGCLQGETIRLVSIGASPRPWDVADYEQPQEFEVVRRLGTGSYAVVYLVREVLFRTPPSDDGHMSILGPMDLDDKSTGRPSTVYGREYAIKCLSKANLDEEALAAQMSEVTIHQSLFSHPNIVTLHRTLETSSFLLLLLEYVPGEDLFYFLEQARDHYESDSPTSANSSVSSSRTPPTPSLLSTLHPSQLLSRARLKLISSMFSQMCDAVAACHDHQVFHRDIKPENFIVTDGWMDLPDGRSERKVVVKLSDFGLSTTDLESSDMDCGSAPYMSYECRNNVAPTYNPRAADVWSLGIVLINMLYHYNPWTDTTEGACSSFDLFSQDPVNFFMNRFTGMTHPVAELLANRVFCILDDPKDDSQRITARQFGAWAKDLPTLLGHHSGSSFTPQRLVSTGHPISSSIPQSHRPTSRHPSGSTSARRTPAPQPRSLSRAPSLGPAYEREEAAELSTVLDHDFEEQEEQDGPEVEIESMDSRSPSTNKRRKRGARKGKGTSAATPTTPKDETLATLAVASQSLAREISEASRSSSQKSVFTRSSSSSSRWGPIQPFEPVSMYGLPTPLLSRRPPAPPVPPVPPLPRLRPSPMSAPPAPVAKKSSKWKLSFGKTSSAALAVAASGLPVEEVPPPNSEDLNIGRDGTQPMSATASNISNVLMSLNAPVPHSAPATSSAKTDDTSSTWSRGRAARLSSSVAHTSGSRSRGPLVGPSPHPSVGFDRRLDRASSPNSTYSGRPVASSASNWRNSTSTMSSAVTSTSGFTRYSNSSMRSVSTTATSVSATSWRTTSKPPQTPVPSDPAHQNVPKNVKIMDGVPWELGQLPRGMHPNPIGDIFGSPPIRKQRTRKPKDLQLDTITERPPNSAAQKSPVYQRRDASTSTTDLSGKDDGDGPRKVQKGQINALAKMLSALRR